MNSLDLTQTLLEVALLFGFPLSVALCLWADR